jgi:hypothetical protein
MPAGDLLPTIAGGAPCAPDEERNYGNAERVAVRHADRSGRGDRRPGRALSGSLVDVGINDDFIKRTRDEITPGTSGLFVLTSNTVLDKVSEAFSGQQPHLLHTNLSNEQEKALREAFAETP